MLDLQTLAIVIDALTVIRGRAQMAELAVRDSWANALQIGKMLEHLAEIDKAERRITEAINRRG